MSTKQIFSAAALVAVVLINPVYALAAEQCGVLETVTVLPNDPGNPAQGITSYSSDLPSGTYSLKASGTWVHKPEVLPEAGIVDAGYFLADADDPVNLGATSAWLPGSATDPANHLETRVNGAVNVWGGFSDSHVYTTVLNHSGGQIAFDIVDSNYADNSGSLSVEISRECADDPAVGGNTNGGKHTKMGKNGPTCESNSIEVTFDASDNGQSKEDVEVKFSYEGDEKVAKTNSNGRATVHYDYKGQDSIKADPKDGYPGQAVHIEELQDCPAEAQVDDAQSQVLGTSTTMLADTGVTTEILQAVIRGVFGAALAVAAAFNLKKQMA